MLFKPTQYPEKSYIFGKGTVKLLGLLNVEWYVFEGKTHSKVSILFEDLFLLYAANHTLSDLYFKI